ncbi:serine protease filzig-like [Contarinia nasturtii]|uniref:serine protease filzig-like n=1 Tax=Contarinia nasturtii TaxID=265458 RepID=UPI0012D49E8A|nr:serine protease filzig-like [Contarinia nasturtii]
MAINIKNLIKLIILLIFYKSAVCADPKIESRTFYWKMCSIFKYSNFCLPYIYGPYSYPAFSQIPGSVVQIAPFPLIVNPSTSAPSYTIPTVYTTTARPFSQSVPQVPIYPSIPIIPNQPFPPVQIPSTTQCPPNIAICPPAALAVPFDPRQGLIRQFNGCPCMDPRNANALPGAQSMNVAPMPPSSPGAPVFGAGPIPSGPIPSGVLGPPPIPGAIIPRPAALQMAPLQFPRYSRAAVSSTNNCDFHSHQCTRLTSCTYFESLIEKGIDALTVGQELRKLFCGYDGFDILICCPLANLNNTPPTTTTATTNQPTMIDIYSTYDGGFANNHGIVFSSINSHGSIAQPMQSISSHVPRPLEPAPQSSNVNNVLDFNSNPFSTSPSSSSSSTNNHIQEVPAKPQSPFSSSGLMFAPLLVTAFPIPQQTVNSTTNHQINHTNQAVPQVTQKPPLSIVPPTTHQTPFSNPTSKCGISKYTGSRVVGGMITQLGQYPWIAALGYRFPNSSIIGLQFYCAGSLITRSHILTSAHCITRYLAVARLGEYDLNSRNDGASPIDFVIERSIVHEEYVPDIILNDIAIVKLRYQAPVNDNIRPICLPLFEPLRSADLTGYRPFVAGWGSTHFQGPQSSILQDTQVPIVSTFECGQSYKTVFSSQIFDERIICAGNGLHDACQGDSGGPLMVSELSENDEGFHFTLVGIVSYGYECARDGFPGVYTRVSAFLPWIQRNLS